MADAATRPIGSPARILVVRLADLGDALLATPAVHALRETFPSARIDVLAAPSGAEVFDLCPAVDRVVRFPKRLFDQPAGLARPANAWLLARLAASLRLARYDAVLLLHHLTTRFGARKFRALCLATSAPIRAGLDNGWGTFLTHRAVDLGFGARPEWRYALDVAAALGAHTAETRPRLAVPDAAREAARNLLASRGVAEEYVVIHPAVGGYSPARAWPLERFVEVARRLRREGEGTRHVVVVGAPGEGRGVDWASVGAVDLTGATSVATLAAVVERAALVVGSDSGVAHLGAALQVPTLAIFGPSNHRAWRPYGAVCHRVGSADLPESDVVVVRAGIPCSPCFYTGYTLGRRDGCHVKTCLDLVTPDEVARVALHLLRRQSNGTASGSASRGSASRD